MARQMEWNKENIMEPITAQGRCGGCQPIGILLYCLKTVRTKPQLYNLEQLIFITNNISLLGTEPVSFVI